MIYIQKKQFEDWWDNQWIRFDSDIETINSRRSCAKDGFEFGLSTVWNEVERLKKELEEARQPEVVGSSEVVSREAMDEVDNKFDQYLKQIHEYEDVTEMDGTVVGKTVRVPVRDREMAERGAGFKTYLLRKAGLLRIARQPEAPVSSEVVSRDVERWYAFVNANALSMLGSHELAEKLYALIDGNHALQLPAPVASPVPTLDELKTGLIAELKKYGHGSIEGIDALRELVYHPEITGIIVRHFHALLTKGRGGV